MLTGSQAPKQHSVPLLLHSGLSDTVTLNLDDRVQTYPELQHHKLHITAVLKYSCEGERIEPTVQEAKDLTETKKMFKK